MAAALDEKEVAIAGAPHRYIEPLVGLMEYRDCRCAEREAVHRILPLGLLIFGCVEQCRRIGCPDQGTNALRCVGQQLARVEIEYVQRVLAEAGVVGGVCELAALRTDGDVADRQKLLALGKLVYVK